MYNIREITKEKSIAVNEVLQIPIPPSFGAGEEAALKFAGTLSKTDKGFRLAGGASAAFKTACSRCLEDCQVLLSFNVEEIFAEENAVNFLNSNDDDYDIISFKGENIDVLPAINKNFLSNIPMRFLCGEDCKGLCGICGGNLNQTECNCTYEPSGPFADLLAQMKQNEE